MSEPADRSVRSLPRPIASRNGHGLVLRLLGPDEHNALVAMYLAFQPRNCFQGLPPLKDEVCVKWVEQMIDTGTSVVAVDRGQAIVGHAALFPIDARRCEMLVVVSPPLQNQGVGTELVRSCIGVARQQGFSQIWLPVDAINGRARHVYRKCGFEYRSPTTARELDMACDLARPEAAPPPLFPRLEMLTGDFPVQPIKR